jgi:rhodanese-related sulfurtransferase
MKTIYVLVLSVVLLLSGCIGGMSDNEGDEMMDDVEMEGESSESMRSSGYMDVSAQEAKQLIDSKPDLVVIDVSPHYDEGHLPGAVNYYLGDGSLDRAIPTLDKNKEYLVYCHVDSVSILGAQKLIDAGLMKVYRLEGNYRAWVDQGYPVEK